MIDPDTNTFPAMIRKDRRRRRWIWVKRIAFLFVVHFALATLIFAIDWKLTRDAGLEKLGAITGKLDADDPGWRFVDIVAEHNSKVPPPETNSAIKVVEIVRRFPTASDSTSLRADIDKGRLPNELPDTADWKAFDAQFAAWEPGIIELRKFDVSTPRGRIAIAYHGGNPIDIKLDQTQHIRTAAFALAWDALRSSHAGRPDPALGSASAGLHLIRSIDFEPTLITCLIRLGSAQAILQSVEQTLAWCRVPSEKSLVEVQELVALESGHTSMRTAQRGDRALMLHMFDLIDRGEIGLESTKPDRDLGTFINKQHLPTNSVYILDRYSEFQTMLELPPAEKATAIRNWQMPPRTRENLMGHLMMPAINKVALADIRYQAKCVCTAAGIVCERYRLKHGKWPAALDDLAEFGIRKGLIDPFDGQPLRYAVKEDGIVIYSVGTDDRDDGGDVVGRGQAQNDTGFRLWNPDRRKVPSPDKQMLEELPQP